MRKIVRAFDRWHSLRCGVFEFSQNPGCLLRLQVAHARHRIPLPDHQVERGELVLLLHLWNERLPELNANVPGLGWARHLQSSLLTSLVEVAAYLNNHPDLAEVRAVGGDTVLLGNGEHKGGTRLVERLGFTVLPYHSPLSSFGEFWENFYSYVLIWAYNPSGLAYRDLRSLRRKEFWISAGEFRSRFGR